MPDFSSWGPEANGARVEQLQEQKMQMSAIAMQAQVQDIQASRTLQQQRQQQMAMQQQQEQERMKKQAVMQQIAMEQKGKDLESHGMALVDAGYIDEGGKILNESSQIIQHQATAKKEQADTETKQMGQKLKVLSVLGNIADSVNSQEDWTKMKAQLESTTGKQLPPQLANLQWSPELKKQLSAFTGTMKDKMEIAIKEKNLASETALRAEQVRLDKAREGLVAAQTREVGARTDKLKKAVGAESKVVRTPKEDVGDAMNMIRNDFPNVDPADPGANIEANFVASQAQALLKKNPALDRATAIHQAYNTAKANGDISTEAKTTKLFGLIPRTKTATKFKPGSKGEKQAAGPMTSERWASMKSGDTFIDEDGNTRRKP